jgi:mannose-6-phosphate isomerase-like protein (cupin superfamily)
MLSQPFHSIPENAKSVRIPELGLDLSVRLPPGILSGMLTVFETVNAVSFGPPLHRHSEAEVFRVIEGSYLFEVDSSRFHAKAGDVVCVPGGAAHAFLNTSNAPSRQMVMMLPGMDAERFFLELAAIMASPSHDRAALNAFGAPWTVEFLGPPLTL